LAIRSASATALAHGLLAFVEIDHRAGLDAARLDMAEPDQFDRMGTPAQRVARRTGLQPRNQTGDLAGADVQRSHKRRLVQRHLPGLRGLNAIETGHALPASSVFSCP
jgi:hypothetical protein